MQKNLYLLKRNKYNYSLIHKICRLSRKTIKKITKMVAEAILNNRLCRKI